MPYTDHLKQVFPDAWIKIQQARKSDACLDEICSDFESLSRDLKLAASDPNRMSAELKADYTGSIEALALEITDWLEKNSIRK